MALQGRTPTDRLAAMLAACPNTPPGPATVPARDKGNWRHGRGARLQVPITEKGLPLEKVTEPESVQRGLPAVGAVSSRNRVVTPALCALRQTVPSEPR